MLVHHETCRKCDDMSTKFTNVAGKEPRRTARVTPKTNLPAGIGSIRPLTRCGGVEENYSTLAHYYHATLTCWMGGMRFCSPCICIQRSDTVYFTSNSTSVASIYAILLGKAIYSASYTLQDHPGKFLTIWDSNTGADYARSTL